MLLIVIGSSFLLIKRYNSNIERFKSIGNSTQNLKIAKEALIGYAATYPDNVNSEVGPGYLLCPDTNNDGVAETNCSLNGETTIGRLPWKTLELEDLYDSSGQTLWYALSENYRYGANKQIPLNSETEGQLSVDSTDDIVAVIFAPGIPVLNQDRVADPLSVSNYLEGDNATNKDNSFVTNLGSSYSQRLDGIYDSNGNLVFNDKLIFITRQELMQAVEKRVLGEVSQILTNYFDTYGAYPWLSTFADPKVETRGVTGTADSGSTATTLIDSGTSSPDFVERGVKAGDIVYNLTDGSIGTVSVDPSSPDSLTVSGLLFGDENDFDENDEYYILIKNLSTVLSGTATINSSGLILEDSSRDLKDIGVSLGDIIENILGTSKSSGIITAITSDEIEVKSLAGDVATNTFANGNSYQVRSNSGVATNAGSSATQLEDSNKNFITMGIQGGDLLWNITDNSYGSITLVTANTLTVDSLEYGTNNTFNNGDQYMLPRFNSSTDTRQGLLAFHEVGEPFKTDLNFDWAITADAGDIVVTDSNILQNYIQNYAASGSESFDDSVGTCIWSIADMADCYGYFRDYVSIAGRAEVYNNSDRIYDSSAQFVTDNVKRGDIAQNYDDETSPVSGTTDAITGTATSGSNVLTLYDSTKNFLRLPVSAGDSINNTTDGSSGVVQSVFVNRITVTSLSGGTNNVFSLNDNYQITYSASKFLYDKGVDFSGFIPHSYIVQNNSMGGRVVGIISKVIDADTIEVESYVGQDSGVIEFDTGDSYSIYQVVKTVVNSRSSENEIDTNQYTSYNPDFDSGEYYRIIPSSTSFGGTVDSVLSTGSTDTLRDWSGDFLNRGIEIGDVIRNGDGSYGEVWGVTANTITTTLYDGSRNYFLAGDNFTVYYNYVYSREHIIHARFRGDQNTTSVSEVRSRDVCLGYSADCSTVAAAVNFSGNGGEALFTIRDYEEDETTQVGEATLTPYSLSTGSIKVSNIAYNLAQTNGDVPSWFIDNDWHKLVYIAYSSDDAPGSVSVCTAGANCLTLDGASLPGNDKRALIVSAGQATSTLRDENCAVLGSEVTQDRSTGNMNSYFELENCDQGDDLFTLGSFSDNFDDQVRVLSTSP